MQPSRRPGKVAVVSRDNLARRADQVAPLYDPLALPRILARPHARRRGYSDDAIDRLVAAGRWRLVLPRTLLTSDTFTWPDRLAAALAFAGEGAVLSGAAALTVDGFRSVRRPDNVLVLVPPPNRTRSAEWVRVRRSRRPVHAELAPGPRRAEVARAVADYALDARELDDVRTVVAEAVRTQRTSVDDLAVELAAGPRQGSARLRQALAEVTGGAWSAPEIRAARAMRRAGLPEFEQNVKVRLSNAAVVIADFLWRHLRAVLEIDSREHHFEVADWRRTMDRHLLLTTDGYAVVHRPPSALADEAQFVRQIGAWLERRARELGVG